MWKSCGVSLARSSIFSTSGCGVGTHTTSLPAWPTVGSNGLAWVWANAGTARLTDTSNVSSRMADDEGHDRNDTPARAEPVGA